VARLRRWGLRRGRLLDVGAGDGQFLLAAQHAGFSVAGSEPSTAGRTRAAARGLDVADAPDAFRGQHFDVITLWHVLEHVADAGALLDALSDLLAPGGALVLAVPNASSVEARVFGGAWFHQDVPRHQLQLTPESLRMLLSRHGWSIAERSSFSIEYDPFGLVQSLWNRLTPRAHNGLYRVLKGNEPLRSLPAGARAPTALALATLPWTAGAALAADAALAPLARTGTMTVLARR
jgi:2-polyprenyl-3-methyl-5-hydroxy-6-metoxy-1,4-benzoquinol methylase